MPRRLRLALPVLLLLCAACGGDEDEPTVDASNPQVTFAGALRAVHDADWANLQRYLTKDARFAMEADMQRLQKNLAARDAQLMRIVEQQIGEGYEAEVAKAVAGGMPAMLRFFVKLSPREREPDSLGVRIDPRTRSVQMGYRIANGQERSVTLVQARGRWYVSNLGL